MNDKSPKISPTEDLLDSISKNLHFFKQGYIFSFEKDKLLQPKNSQPERPSIFSNNTDHKYDGQHPTLCESKNYSISDLFRKKKTIDVMKINMFDVPIDVDRSFFISFSYEKQNGWFIRSKTESFLFFEETRAIEVLSNNLKITLLEDKYLKFNNQNALYQLKIYQTNSYQSIKKTKPDLQSICDFINRVLTSKKCFSYEYFLLSFKECGSYPSITIETLRFYHQIVEDPQFLYIISEMACLKNESSTDFIAWTEASGHFFKMLFQIISFEYFQSLRSPSDIFKSNSYLSYLTTTLFRMDSKFYKFCDIFNPPTENPIEYFLETFSEFQFDTFSTFILKTLFEEANRSFPNTDACYNALGNILFVRVLSTIVLQRDENLKHQMKQIFMIFKFETNDQHVIRLKEILKNKANSKINELYIKRSGFTPLSHVQSLIKRILNNSDNFFDVIHKVNFGALLNNYKKVINS